MGHYACQVQNLKAFLWDVLYVEWGWKIVKHDKISILYSAIDVKMIFDDFGQKWNFWFSPRRGFRRRDIESEYFQIIIQIIFWESCRFNLWDFSRVDTFKEYHIWVSESVNRQYKIEKVKSLFCPALVMMHIDRNMSPSIFCLRLWMRLL